MCFFEWPKRLLQIETVSASPEIHFYIFLSAKYKKLDFYNGETGPL